MARRPVRGPTRKLPKERHTPPPPGWAEPLDEPALPTFEFDDSSGEQVAVDIPGQHASAQEVEEAMTGAVDRSAEVLATPGAQVAREETPTEKFERLCAEKKVVDDAQVAAKPIYDQLIEMAKVATSKSYRLFVTPAEATLIVAHTNAMVRFQREGDQTPNEEWFDGDQLGTFLGYALVVKSANKRPPKRMRHV